MGSSLIAGILLVVGLIILYFVFAKPGSFSSKSSLRDSTKYLTIEDKYNAERREKEIELDKLLDKIAKKGIESLSKYERERLEQLSGKK